MPNFLNRSRILFSFRGDLWNRWWRGCSRQSWSFCVRGCWCGFWQLGSFWLERKWIHLCWGWCFCLDNGWLNPWRIWQLRLDGGIHLWRDWCFCLNRGWLSPWWRWDLYLGRWFSPGWTHMLRGGDIHELIHHCFLCKCHIKIECQCSSLR
jgi:hypothetical protein